MALSCLLGGKIQLVDDVSEDAARYGLMNAGMQKLKKSKKSGREIC